MDTLVIHSPDGTQHRLTPLVAAHPPPAPAPRLYLENPSDREKYLKDVYLKGGGIDAFSVRWCKTLEEAKKRKRAGDGFELPLPDAEYKVVAIKSPHALLAAAEPRGKFTSTKHLYLVNDAALARAVDEGRLELAGPSKPKAISAKKGKPAASSGGSWWALVCLYDGVFESLDLYATEGAAKAAKRQTEKDDRRYNCVVTVVKKKDLPPAPAPGTLSTPKDAEMARWAWDVSTFDDRRRQLIQAIGHVADAEAEKLTHLYFIQLRPDIQSRLKDRSAAIRRRHEVMLKAAGRDRPPAPAPKRDIVEQLIENRDQILEILDEMEMVLQGAEDSMILVRAQSYWLAHIRGALVGQTSMIGLNDTIEELGGKPGAAFDYPAPPELTATEVMLKNDIIVRRYPILGTSIWVYSAWEPDAEDHSSITRFQGVKGAEKGYYGKIGTVILPRGVAALSGRERVREVVRWLEGEYARAYKYIQQAFPETLNAYGRASMGEITFVAQDLIVRHPAPAPVEGERKTKILKSQKAMHIEAGRLIGKGYEVEQAKTESKIGGGWVLKYWMPEGGQFKLSEAKRIYLLGKKYVAEGRTMDEPQKEGCSWHDGSPMDQAIYYIGIYSDSLRAGKKQYFGQPTEEIIEEYRAVLRELEKMGNMAPAPPKLDRCVAKVSGRPGVVNPWAICQASLKRGKTQ